MRLYVDMDIWRFRLTTNNVSKVLRNMIGTEQRITLAYHPQWNGLCEWQNETISDVLVKVLDGNPCNWRNVIKGVLFVYRVNKHFDDSFLGIIGSLLYRSMYNLVDTESTEVNTLLTKQCLMPCLQLRSPWEQTYIKQLVRTFVPHKKNNTVIIVDAIKCLTRLKWVKKCYWRTKEGWIEKVARKGAP